jgi:hypothetical protein
MSRIITELTDCPNTVIFVLRDCEMDDDFRRKGIFQLWRTWTLRHFGHPSINPQASKIRQPTFHVVYVHSVKVSMSMWRTCTLCTTSILVQFLLSLLFSIEAIKYAAAYLFITILLRHILWLRSFQLRHTSYLMDDVDVISCSEPPPSSTSVHFGRKPFPFVSTSWIDDPKSTN